MANATSLAPLFTWLALLIVSAWASVSTLDSCPDHCYCFVVSMRDAPPTALLSRYMRENDWLEGSKAMACWGRSRMPRLMPSSDIKYLILIGSEKPKRSRRRIQPALRTRRQRGHASLRNGLPQYVHPLPQFKRKNIRNIPADAFTDLQQIIQLDLHGNKITQLAPSTFQGMAHLTDLNLDNNRIKTLRPELLRDVTALRKFHVAGNFLRSLPDNLFATTEIIQFLDLSDNLLSYIPDNCLQTLTELTHLNLSYNRVSERSEMMLAGMGRLTNLYLQRNKFARLTTMFFLSNSQLRNVDLSYNRIRMIDTNAFQNQNQLHTLDLSGNALTVLDSLAFNGVTSLNMLDLSYNTIKEVTRSVFSEMTALTTLQMRGNNLTNITSETFGNIPSLTSLTLAENNISYIAPDSMAGLDKLEFLDLSKNRNRHLRARCFQGLSDLMELNLAENELFIIEPESFKTTRLSFMSKLTWLNLQGNRLVELQGDVFLGAPSLRVLTISKNSISRISAKAFSWFGRLHRLVLSENHLEALASGPFRSLRTLEMLDLSNNRIRLIADDAFKGLAGLNTISLAHNALRSDGMSWLKHLESVQTLNLNDNEFDRFVSGDFEAATNLRYLFLSQNDLTSLSIPGDSRLYLYNLTLANNMLSSIDEIPAHILPGRAINLAHNPWHCNCRLVTLFSDMMRRYGVRLDKEGNTRCRTPDNLHGAKIADLVNSGVQCEGTELVNVEKSWTTMKPPSITADLSATSPAVTKTSRQWSWVAVMWDSVTDMPVCNGAVLGPYFVTAPFQCLRQITNIDSHLRRVSQCSQPLADDCKDSYWRAPSNMEIKVAQGEPRTMSDFRTLAQTYRVLNIYKVSQYSATDDSSSILLQVSPSIDLDGSSNIQILDDPSKTLDGKRVLTSGWWIDRSSAPAVVGKQKRRHYTLTSSLCDWQNDVHRTYLCGTLEQHPGLFSSWDGLGSPVAIRQRDEWKLVGLLVRQEGDIGYIKDLRQDIPTIMRLMYDLTANMN